MTNPFVDLVNKVRAKLFAPVSILPGFDHSHVSRAEKPESERLSKTVMPHVTRTIAPQDPLQAAASGSPSATLLTASAKTRPMVSVGATHSALQKHDLPPAIALALEPKVERAISLQLSDILQQVPAGYIKSEESFDPTRRVLLKAVEIEKGMAKRNPNVALTSIYEQIPEIFMRSVPLSDPTHIDLPFDKVLEQFNRLQVRRDQLRDESIPQVDTPFLLVALEESEKFGTTIDPLQASAHPPVTVETATADTLAAAEPEAAESVTVTPTSPPRSAIPIPDSRVEENPPHHFSPTRIPFHLPPKGTGAPASERVPASSGPPVLPPSVPTPPRSEAPSKPPRPVLPKLEPPVMPPTLRNPYEAVPFDQLKLSSPSARSTSESPAEMERPRRRRKPADTVGFEPLTPSLAAPLGDVAAQAPLVAASSEPPKQEDEKIVLSLRLLLQNLPAFQRQGDPSLAPEDVNVNLSLSMIVPQLATGRVTVPPKIFHEAIPADYRYLFHIDEAETPVLLPLQEVLKNVPAHALQIRADQEQLVASAAIETPFSIQADEDARRLKGEQPPTLESIFDKPRKIDKQPDEKIDAKQVVARATALPGVNGCAITFADGLSLAGNLPPAIAADGLCAVAPTLLQRIDKHMLDTKLGSLSSMTLQGAASAVTFFMHGNICLAALHTTEALAPETRRQLGQMVNKLSRVYSQPEITHVDH